MSIYMSRAELEEISEGLITAYANKFSNRVIQSIDIEHFITEFLMLNIKVIQDALGHSDISTTLNIYADVTKEMKAAEFKGLDSYFVV